MLACFKKGNSFVCFFAVLRGWVVEGRRRSEGGGGSFTQDMMYDTLISE